MEEWYEVNTGPATQRLFVRISARGPEFLRKKQALLVSIALPIVSTGLFECLSSPLD